MMVPLGQNRTKSSQHASAHHVGGKELQRIGPRANHRKGIGGGPYTGYRNQAETLGLPHNLGIGVRLVDISEIES
jgi:hypothetical protein